MMVTQSMDGTMPKSFFHIKKLVKIPTFLSVVFFPSPFMSFTADTIKRLFEQPLTAQQYVAITSGTIATGLAILAILYPDRAAFDNDDRIFARRKGYPILGNLPHLLQNVDHVHDFMLLNFETFGRTL
jgi:hypothetical protein